MAVPDCWQVAGAILATSREREMYIRIDNARDRYTVDEIKRKNTLENTLE